MTASTAHPQRVAWDGARAFVRAATGPDFLDFSWRVRELLGREFYAELVTTREALIAADRRTGGDRFAHDVEAGRWRWRLDDLIRSRPELSAPLAELALRSRKV